MSLKPNHLQSEFFQANQEHMTEQLQILKDTQEKIALGGDEKSRQKHVGCRKIIT